MAPFAAKKTGHRVWPVTEFLGGFFYALFRGWRDVARHGALFSTIETVAGEKPLDSANIPHGDGLVLSALPLHAWASGGTIIWCLRFELQDKLNKITRR